MLLNVQVKRVGYFYENRDQEKLAKAKDIMRIICGRYGRYIEFLDLVRDLECGNTLLDNKINIVEVGIDDNRLDVILVLGGDGTMLKAIHYFMMLNVPFYGLNIGSVGFLLNNLSNCDSIVHSIYNATQVSIHPLEMIVNDINNNQHKVLAINEVSLLRNGPQSAHIAISINNVLRLEKLVADGILLSTPAGSTAYNYAVGGPIIPLEATTLILMPISPFRPRRWRGAVIPNDSILKFVNLMPKKRFINVFADSNEVRDMESVEVKMRSEIIIKLLFNQGNCIHERIIAEQFAV